MEGTAGQLGNAAVQSVTAPPASTECVTNSTVLAGLITPYLDR